ncbi:MAG: single-stranded DNA-binding protein [Saprospiraceae bacterium]|nr:single-stranded DNA-binding protein [Saprospiraceae bacterium]
MINKVILIGNLGRDPEVRHLDNGAAVAKMSIATNESYRDKSGEWQTNTEWHDIVMWRALAERAERSLKKGSMIYVEGKLTHRKYQDKDGNDRYITEVVANTFRMLDRREGGRPDTAFPSAADAPTSYQKETDSAPAAPTTGAPVTGTVTSATTTPMDDDDDLPF